MSYPLCQALPINMNSAQAIDRLRQVIRRQHKALSTEEAYVSWLRRYIKALATIDSALSSEKKLECFLTRLAQADVSASSQNQAFNAIAFFYREVLDKALGRVDGLRAKRPVHERHAPSVAETQLLLQTIQNVGGYPTNLIARLLYGCGLRVSEPLNLRTKDIDLKKRTLCIRGAKGGNDRVVALPASLLPELGQQIQAARSVWQHDRQNQTPLMLPHQLAKKYPEYQFSWGWACPLGHQNASLSTIIFNYFVVAGARKLYAERGSAPARPCSPEKPVLNWRRAMNAKDQETIERTD